MFLKYFSRWNKNESGEMNEERRKAYADAQKISTKENEFYRHDFGIFNTDFF